MVIGIDISQVIYQGTGVARYTRNLIEGIVKYDNKNSYIFFFSSLRQDIPPDLEKIIKVNHQLVKLKLPPAALELISNRLHFPFINRLMKAMDIFISSDWTQPALSRNVKKITIVHDLVYLKYPETLPQSIISVQTRRMNWVKKEVDLILADSKSTKNDIVELLKIPEDKIKVLYPAVKLATKQFSNETIKQTVKKPYILSVGKLEPRKNIPRLIEAFQQANLKNVELWIVGMKGWSFPITNNQLPITKNVKLLGFVPDEHLYHLYHNALMFVYPSLYEGFGYPVIEAMSSGCPVTCSNTSSIGEIAKNNSLLFDPNDSNSIKNAILKIYKNPELQQTLKNKGRIYSLKFTPKYFYQQFNKIIA